MNFATSCTTDVLVGQAYRVKDVLPNQQEPTAQAKAEAAAAAVSSQGRLHHTRPEAVRFVIRPASIRPCQHNAPRSYNILASNDSKDTPPPLFPVVWLLCCDFLPPPPPAREQATRDGPRYACLVKSLNLGYFPNFSSQQRKTKRLFELTVFQNKIPWAMVGGKPATD